MPKTKFQSIIFTLIMAFCMVFCMTAYSIESAIDAMKAPDPATNSD